MTGSGSAPIVLAGVYMLEVRSQTCQARRDGLLFDVGVKGVEEHPDAGMVHRLAKTARVFAPIGLDIGAETPDEIALAIVAEVQAVLAGRRGASLRERGGGIHAVAAT